MRRFLRSKLMWPIWLLLILFAAVYITVFIQSIMSEPPPVMDNF